MTTKRFDLAQVLTVMTKTSFVEDFGRAHELWNHLTGQDLFTHQLMRAFEPCAESLKRQFPALANVTPPENIKNVWRTWLAEQRAIHGDAFYVEPMASGAFERKDPIAEAAEMFGDRLVVVQAPDAD